MLDITILGCGYMGLQLAEHLQKSRHHITGTTTSYSRLPILEQKCQKALLLWGDDLEKLTLAVENSDVIIVTISAASLQEYEKTFLRTAQNLRKIAKNCPEKKLLYTSSTFVYGDHKGKWVDETSPLLNTSDVGKTLVTTENTLLSLEEYHWDVTILRLSEIYGPGRELSTKLEKYQNKILPGSGNIYTNMVHSKDIVYAIDYILHHDLKGIYNLSDDEHPHKQDLYDLVAKKYNLEKVEWDPKIATIKMGNKRVSNHKIKEVGYQFFYPKREY